MAKLAAGRAGRSCPSQQMPKDVASLDGVIARRIWLGEGTVQVGVWSLESGVWSAGGVVGPNGQRREAVRDEG